MNDLRLLREICNWLSHQKGMIPQAYARELAILILNFYRQDRNSND